MHVELSSVKFVFCEISHFTAFARILVFSPKKRVGQLYRCFLYQVVSLQCQSFTKNLQSPLFSENLVFYEISHFITFARILVFKPYKRIGQLCSSLLYHSIITLTKLLRNPGSRAIFRKTTNFNRSLVYFPWIKSLTTLQVLLTLNRINMTPAFLKKGSINSLLKKLYFEKFRILLLFLNTFFINCKHLEQLCRYFKV